MDKEIESFVFHKDWYEAIRDLDDKSRLEIYDAIMSLAYNEEIKNLSPTAKMAMKFIQPHLERDKDKYQAIRQKRREAGKKGNQTRWGEESQKVANIANATTESQNIASVADSVSVSVSVSDSVSKDMLDISIPQTPKGGFGKGDKKKKEIPFNVRADLSYVDCFEDLWREWLDYKDEIGSQYKTQRGAVSAFSKLKKLSEGDKKKAQSILEQSYQYSWTSFREIRERPEDKNAKKYKDRRPTFIEQDKEYTEYDATF